MILLLKSGLSGKCKDSVLASLEALGFAGRLVVTERQDFVIVEGDTRSAPSHLFTTMDGVEKVFRTESQCPRTTEFATGPVKLKNGTCVGATGPVFMAGPCSVEGEDHARQIAAIVRDAGATVLRGGAFKPRTSPYDFQGLGLEGLKLLSQAASANGLALVSEVMSCKQVGLAYDYVDMLQVGARNMYNYELLKEVGRQEKPVLLKRAFQATVSEFLQAAEYVLLGGNSKLVLCERGIRTFETHTRNTLDLSAVPVLKSMSGLPVIVDPSHATGRSELVRPMSRAAIACGADGLLIEVHSAPEKALSDGQQAVTPAELQAIIRECTGISDLLSAQCGDVSGQNLKVPVASA